METSKPEAKKMGRPTLAQHESSVRKSITLPKSMLQHAMSRSQHFGNFSEYVRHLVEKDLNNSNGHANGSAASNNKDD